MKKVMVSVFCLMISFSQFVQAEIQSSKMSPLIPRPAQSSSPQMNPEKIKEAKEYCLKSTKMSIPKKGVKLDKDKMAKFRECMHEKLVPEINKIRQQPRK